MFPASLNCFLFKKKQTPALKFPLGELINPDLICVFHVNLELAAVLLIRWMLRNLNDV